MDARETDRNQQSRAADEVAELDRTSSPPTTAGAGPGGAQSGLHHGEGYPIPTPEGAGPAAGPALTTGAGGGSGTGADGLATGAGGSGGTRNALHGQGQPGYGTTEGELPPEGGYGDVDVDLSSTSGVTTQGTATT